jgi:putative transcriptional regulator
MEGSDMVRLNVQALLDKKGKTRYWLYKQLGMSYQNFKNMIDNKTQSIRYDRIETLCLLLDCTPNELFEFDLDRE